jgi:hypothetical protein
MSLRQIDAKPTVVTTFEGGVIIEHIARVAADPGEQVTKIGQRMTLGTCEEVACDWFLFGHEGVDALGNRTVHPAGARCGDVRSCPDPECPCTARCYQTTDACLLSRFKYVADSGVGFLVGYHHTPLQDPAMGLRYRVDERVTVEDEFIQRTGEGLETLRFIRERGL